MKTSRLRIFIYFAAILLATLSSCTPQDREFPYIFPDYRDITVPPNIAPLNFCVNARKATATFDNGSETFTLKARKGVFKIPERKWKSMATPGVRIKVDVTGMETFTWTVAEEEIDPYLAYRLIDPCYEAWNEVGLYQRDLESYDQDAIITNRQTDKNCMNCHSFCGRDPGRMLFHMRGNHGATYMIRDGAIEKLNTKTDSTISALVYPSWHPSGDFVAFSVNDTRQAFHSHSRDRIEVYDAKSDVVVYDVSGHNIISCPLLKSPDSFETFPTFTPDGKTLIYCTAVKQHMPHEYDRVRYNVCSIGFDPETKTFSDHADTLFDAASIGRSASFPRVSPDGEFLLFTLSDFGNFSIWHKSADIWMMDMGTGESWPLEEANSDDVDSYHSWSSNGRWIVFSSRRIDGLYTRPYFCHIDTEGKASKAFLLPQKDPWSFNKRLMKSYNIPEFISGKVSFPERKIVKTALGDPGIQINYE